MLLVQGLKGSLSSTCSSDKAKTPLILGLNLNHSKYRSFFLVLNCPKLLSSTLFSLLDKFKAVETPARTKGLKLFNRLLDIFNSNGK